MWCGTRFAFTFLHYKRYLQDMTRSDALVFVLGLAEWQEMHVITPGSRLEQICIQHGVKDMTLFVYWNVQS